MRKGNKILSIYICALSSYELNEIRDWIAQSNSISSKTLLNEWLIGDGVITIISYDTMIICDRAAAVSSVAYDFSLRVQKIIFELI